jgi:anaerobic selenocysteine-containing dehydrogenase
MKKATMARRSFIKLSAMAAAATTVGATVPSALAESGSSAGGNGEVQRIRTCCRGCGKMECGVWAIVQDGKVIRVEGDESAFQSMGNCCTKSQASIQACYHPDRLKYPLKRTNPKGSSDPGWQRISWDEAAQTAGQKFLEIQEKYGGAAMFTMGGTSRIWPMYPYAAWKAILDTPNAIIASHICKGPRQFATRINSAQAFNWMETVGRPTCFVVWAGGCELSNYDDSCRTVVDVAMKADTFIDVDPRMANLGKEADYWMNLRPGTDAALALSWANVIIENDLYDSLYVKRWTNAPFLVCDDIEPSGFKCDVQSATIKTRLLKESDIVEGGSPMRFMVWDSLREAAGATGNDCLTYWQADPSDAHWEGETWTKQTEGFTPEQHLLPGVSQGWVADLSPFDPEIDPALFGEFEITLKDGRTSKVRPVFDLYAERAAEYAPDKAAEITGIPAEKIEAAALAFATRKDPRIPNGGIQMQLGLEHATNAIENVRALDCLVGLVGAMDTPGANRGATEMPVGQAMDAASPAIMSRVGQPEHIQKRLGRDRWPLFDWWNGWGDPTTIYDAVHTGEPYRVVAGVIQGSDFMNQSNSNYAWEALNMLDFLLVIDLWDTPTCGAADIVMPSYHWLENSGHRISQGAHGALGANQQCIEAPGECRRDYEAVIAVMKVMNLPFWTDESNPWPTWDELLDIYVANMDMTWEEYAAQFQENGWIDAKELQPWNWGTYRRYEVGQLYHKPPHQQAMTNSNINTPGWPTPTMKQEFWSTIIETYHPNDHWEICNFDEPIHSPVRDAETYKEYPFQAITGRRIPVYFHSEHRQLPWCREQWPAPRMEINPADAEELGLEQGEWVWIESPWGKIRQTVDIYYGIKPGTVNLEHQWWFPELRQADKGFALCNANCLVDKDAHDKLSSTSNLRVYPVKIYKATPENSPFGDPCPCGEDGTEIIHDASDPRLKEWLPVYEERG